MWRCIWGMAQRGNNAACLALTPLSRNWQFLLPLQPPQSFTARDSQILFSLCCNPGLSGLSCSSCFPPCLSAHKCGTTQSTSHHLTCPLHQHSISNALATCNTRNWGTLLHLALVLALNSHTLLIPSDSQHWLAILAWFYHSIVKYIEAA